VTNLRAPLQDLVQKYASVLDEVLKVVTTKITIFCIIIKCIAHHKPKDVSEQSLASVFRAEEMSKDFFHIRTAHLDIIKLLFIHQLMY